MFAAWPRYAQVLTVVATLLLAAPAPAAVIIVPDDIGTIQDAIDTASSGDSVVIRPGTYHESLTLAGKDVSLIGEMGPDSTMLSGDDAFRILDLGTGVGTVTRIGGFSFKDGRASQGGAVQLLDGASPRFVDCRFSRNRATRGGALYLDGSSYVQVEDCQFISNFGSAATQGGESYGGAVYATATSFLLFRRTDFVTNVAQGFEGGPGGAVYQSGSRVDFASCRFVGNFGLVGGIFSHDCHLTVRNCSFESNWNGFGASAVESRWDTLNIVGNTFANEYSTWVGVIHAEGSMGVIASNTIVSSSGAGIVFGGDIRVANNLVAYNSGVGISCSSALFGVVECNNVWNNSPNFGTHCDLGSGGNISVDPLFCDPSNSDFHLSASSPCSPDSSACGLIGALPVACGVVGVRSQPRRPQIARLYPVSPNPARSVVSMTFTIGKPGAYTLEIFDVSGRRHAVLTDGWLEAGSQSRTWPSTRNPERRIAPGTYFAVLRSTSFRQAQRFVVLD